MSITTKHLSEARQLGTDAALCAASWTIDGTMPDDSVRRAYRARAAELAAMDATRRMIINAAPADDPEYVPFCPREPGHDCQCAVRDACVPKAGA